MFYRYKSIGGYEYVADFLIGPDKGQKSLKTRHGDSGAVWAVENKDKGDTAFLPIAMQWGGQVFLNAAQKSSSYALATFLSTVCNELDITLLRGWNTGLPEY